MRNRFDQLSKQIGQAALWRSGATFAHDEINPETQYADIRYEPDPSRDAERRELGLLGRFAGFACLIEVYSQAPSSEEFRACLAKHLAFWRQRERERRPRAEEKPDLPFLWVVGAGSPKTLLTELAPVIKPDWPAGVYFVGGDVLRVGIVAATELPRDSATLLVRMMAAGPLLAQAIREVAALPPNATARVVVEPVPLSFQNLLGQSPTRDPEEQEFIMAMIKSWEEGKAEARAEAQARDVLTVLRVRGIAVSDAIRERILAQKDTERLERWLERAVVVSAANDVLDEPS
jgi:hypothetical protein